MRAVMLLGALVAASAWAVTAHAQRAPETAATPTADATATDATAPSAEVPTATTAPDPAVLAEAQGLFRHAVELGDQDRWAEALVLFRRSLELVPRPSTQFNVGFALFRLGQFREAIAVLDAYLAATEGDESPLRAEATTRRAQAVASLAALTVEVSPPDAQLRIDGAVDPSTGASRTLALDPGRHLLLATAPDHHDGQLEVSLLAAEQRAVTLHLEPDAPPPPDDVLPIEPSEGERSVLDEPLFWILAGVAVVAVGVGVGVGVAVGSSTEAPYPGSTGVVLRMP
jgi:hypothetical protein